MNNPLDLPIKQTQREAQHTLGQTVVIFMNKEAAERRFNQLSEELSAISSQDMLAHGRMAGKSTAFHESVKYTYSKLNKASSVIDNCEEKLAMLSSRLVGKLNYDYL